MVKRIINKIKRTVIPYVTFGKHEKFRSLGIDFNSYKNIIVMETTFGWDGIMMQRPQQVAISFDKDTLVLYHSSKDRYENAPHCNRIADNLYVLNLDVYRDELIEASDGCRNKIIIFYSTDPTPISVVEKYTSHGYKPIYEYVDDLSPELSSKRVYKKLLSKHDYVLKNKVPAVCTATKLLGNISGKTRTALITNGCDYGHFKAAEYSLPNDMNFGSKKKIVGYYGAIAEWMDYALLEKIAKTNKYEIVLLGISYDGSFERSGLAKYENIHFLGKKPYGTLPSYAAHFDVCMIPFVISDLTASTSPVKLFEYMAAEKPIVTTDLAECRKYESVMCASGHEEFILLLEKALSLSDDPEYKNKLKEEALKNTWASKCRDILDFASVD